MDKKRRERLYTAYESYVNGNYFGWREFVNRMTKLEIVQGTSHISGHFNVKRKVVLEAFLNALVKP